MLELVTAPGAWPREKRGMVDRARFELAASSMPRRRSSELIYRPTACRSIASWLKCFCQGAPEVGRAVQKAPQTQASTWTTAPTGHSTGRPGNHYKIE